MIQGIGADIIEIERFRHSILRFGDRLILKLFTAEEISYCSSQKNPAELFTAHFAAKEAFSKALATGNTGIFNWKDVEVIGLSKGIPALQCYHAVAERLKTNTVQLTLSTTKNSVMAFVLIQSNEQ